MFEFLFKYWLVILVVCLNKCVFIKYTSLFSVLFCFLKCLFVVKFIVVVVELLGKYFNFIFLVKCFIIIILLNMISFYLLWDFMFFVSFVWWECVCLVFLCFFLVCDGFLLVLFINVCYVFIFFLFLYLIIMKCNMSLLMWYNCLSFIIIDGFVLKYVI